MKNIKVAVSGYGVIGTPVADDVSVQYDIELAYSKAIVNRAIRKHLALAYSVMAPKTAQTETTETLLIG